MASGSHCIADGGDAILHVTLENTGEDERTVNVSPVLRDDDGTTTESPLEAVEVTVSGATRRPPTRRSTPLPTTWPAAP